MQCKMKHGDIHDIASYIALWLQILLLGTCQEIFLCHVT